MSAWERFGVELILSFLLVLTYCGATDCARRGGAPRLGGAPPGHTVGAAYLACTLVSMPYLNPARALGPAFVMNKWDNHWVYWMGPILGGMIAGLVYEFIFSPRRQSRRPSDSIDGDSSSIHSEEDPYDDLDKGAGKLHHGIRSVQPGGDIYRPVGPPTLGSPTGQGGYCPGLTSASLYSAPPCKLERVESLYGGTKSLYAKSPPLTRANLNRSQSVYTKTSVSGPIMPRPGPLVPAQSLYPMRLGPSGPTPVIAPHCIASQQQQQKQQQEQQQQQQQQQPQQTQQQQQQQVSASQPNVGEVLSSATHSATTTANQNVQNQQNAARNESVYGVRGAASGAASGGGGVYGVSSAAQPPQPSPGGSSTATSNSSGKHERRPESLYGMARRQDSGDSSYGSYQSSAERDRDRPANGHAHGHGPATNMPRQGNYGHLPALPIGGKCVVGGSITVTANGNYGSVGMRHSPHGMAHPQPSGHMTHHQNPLFAVHHGPPRHSQSAHSTPCSQY